MFLFNDTLPKLFDHINIKNAELKESFNIKKKHFSLSLRSTESTE
jgi:hypothetical protein